MGRSIHMLLTMTSLLLAAAVLMWRLKYPGSAPAVHPYVADPVLISYAYFEKDAVQVGRQHNVYRSA